MSNGMRCVRNISHLKNCYALCSKCGNTIEMSNPYIICCPYCGASLQDWTDC